MNLVKRPILYILFNNHYLMEVFYVLIPVIYADDSYDMVEDFLLNELIVNNKIKAFKRSSGWVRIGQDRVRKIDYSGPERRGRR